MSAISKCPKCGFTAQTPFRECARCGIVVQKYLKRAAEAQQAGSTDDPQEKHEHQGLAQTDMLMVRQHKEWGEIVTGIETRNRYEVITDKNSVLMQVEEESGSAITVLTRMFLKSLRPFTMHLFSPQGALLYQIKRPFRFFFHEVEILKANGTVLGTVKRRFSFVRRIYSVADSQGVEIYELFGPFFHPWTFHIRKGITDLGQITKKWSGLLKESFTDADNFGIVFPNKIDTNQKAVLLGAVFLIDFVHFENSSSQRNA